MNIPQIQAGLKRFAKGFLAGGIAQVALIIGPGLSFHSLDDIRAIITALTFGFIVGGLLSVQKMLSWQQVPTPIIDGTPTGASYSQN